ncbi:hypothetical protein [Alkalihalobacterium bogoriense]|uniref:hypothetical protein n=1 Tax=Alkalihalobacterium bogoriense TaxID=246272 RepID=UPI000479C9C3|nr:hypothetical protein [Alkalihalobacterium bogoriense]
MKKVLLFSLALSLFLFGCGVNETASVTTNSIPNETLQNTTQANERQKNPQEVLDLTHTEPLTYENQYHAYTLSLPGHWIEKYGVDENQKEARLYYQSETGENADLVTIFTVPQQQWEQDKLGQLHYLTEKDGFVYFFVLPLDNPFETEEKQKEYSKMVEEAHIAMSTFSLSGEEVSGSPMVALDLFFHAFQSENYELAAHFYGGEYEWIHEKTKGVIDIASDDKTGILQAFIENLGGEVTYLSNVSEPIFIEKDNTYQFIVSLLQADGSPYVPLEDSQPLAFHVKAIDGTYKVMELPSIATLP